MAKAVYKVEPSVLNAWEFVERWDKVRSTSRLLEGTRGFTIDMPVIALGSVLGDPLHGYPTQEHLERRLQFCNQTGNGYHDKALNERFYMLQNKTLEAIVERLKSRSESTAIKIVQSYIVKPVV